MAESIETERKRLTTEEFEAVGRTHHPQLGTMGKAELVEVMGRLRVHRDKTRDALSRQRREIRGKATPRGARPATDSSGLALKLEILTDAMTRAKKALRRMERRD